MTGSSSTVVSRSALVTITVPSTIGSSDPLVALIVGCCPPYQTTTTIISTAKVTKNDTSHLSVTVGPDIYTQRNAILRCLCGSGYHGALDTTPRLLLLGGHYASTSFSAGAGDGGGACKSPVSACVMASIASWMSVASSVRDNDSSSNNNMDEDVMLLITQLNGYLATRSFVVVPTPRPTLADLDLYFALLSRLTTTASTNVHEEQRGGGGGGDSMIEMAIGGLGNVRRWLETCSVTVDELMDIAVKNSVYSKVPIAVIPMLAGLLRPIPRPTPIFFYGTEDEEVAILSTSIAPAGKSPSDVVGTAATAGGGVGQSNNMDGGLTDEQKKASADKKAKKNAEKTAAKAKEKPKSGGNATAVAGTTSESSDLTIAALDIRVGRIIKASFFQSVLSSTSTSSSSSLSIAAVDMSEEKIMEEIKVGDKLPSLVLQEGIGEYKTVEVNIANLIANKKVVIFGVPGAFTPGCSKSHVPSFITAYDELQRNGIDMIICIATNDAYVMEAWGRMSGGTEAGMRFLSDTNGVLSTAIGLVKIDGMMIRTKRFSLIANDGIVTHYFSSMNESSDTWAPNVLSAL